MSLPENRKALELRSLVKASGELELSLASVDIARPKPGGVAQVGISETDVQVHLLARDDGGHELRVHTGGYQISSTPAGAVTGSEVSSVTPRGDTYTLRFAGPGDVVLHVRTLNDDQPLTVDVPLHIAR